MPPVRRPARSVLQENGTCGGHGKAAGSQERLAAWLSLLWQKAALSISTTGPRGLAPEWLGSLAIFTAVFQVGGCVAHA